MRIISLETGVLFIFTTESWVKTIHCLYRGCRINWKPIFFIFFWLKFCLVKLFDFIGSCYPFIQAYFICLRVCQTAQKQKFSLKYYFSKCDQIRSFLRIWSHLLKKSLMKNFIFCAMSGILMFPESIERRQWHEIA